MFRSLDIAWIFELMERIFVFDKQKARGNDTIVDYLNYQVSTARSGQILCGVDCAVYVHLGIPG